MAEKRPTADVTINAWHAQDGSLGSLFQEVADDDPDTYMQTALLDDRPVRVLVFVTDDHRRDELTFMPETRSRIQDAGVTFLQHRTDSPTCAPARQSLFTGFQQSSHLVTIGDPNDYYRYCVQGKKIDADWWAGPWEKQYDTARQANDDPAQSTGSLPNWLVAAGVTTGLIGKYQNAYARSQTVGGVQYGSLDGSGTPLGVGQFPLGARRVPPDWHYWCGKTGDDSCVAGSSANWDGGNQDSYNEWFVIKDEDDTSNIGTNTDTEGTPEYHFYKKTVVSGTISGTTATIVVTDHGIDATDDTSKKIIVKNCSPSGYNTSGEVTATVIDANTLSYTVTGSPPAGPITAGGFCYPKRWYATAFMSDKLFEFLNRRGETESWFAFVAVDAPHNGQTDSVEVEQNYLQTENANDFHYYGGVAGAYAPTINPLHSRFSAAKSQWRQRQETLKSLDDLVARIDDYLTDRGWADTIIIFVGDQGAHLGEHDIYVDGGGKYFAKNTAYEPACGMPCIIRYPGCVPGSTVDVPTHHMDIPLTVLDFFGLTDHAAHDNRDGVSLLRVIDDHPFPDRAFYLRHALPSKPEADALVDADGYKWIDAVPPATQPVAQVEQLYYLPDDPDEATNLLPTEQARADLMRARAAVLEHARGDDYRTG